MGEQSESAYADTREGILLVDDSEIMLRILNSLCERSGYTVVGQAKDGQEAIEMYESCRPLIVLMDVNMPNIDGLEATRRIIDIHPDAKIVIISAENDRSMVVDTIRAGACSYIIKPVHPEKLLEVLNQIQSDVNTVT